MSKAAGKQDNRRFILSLPAELLAQLDALTREEGLSRAEMCRRALASLVEDRARIQGRTKALQALRFLRKELGPEKRWRPTEAIRDSREENRLAPGRRAS